jgi:putative NADH-flavin reductase
MKILVLGATGRTGMCIVQEALKRGIAVSAIARDPSKLSEYSVGITEGTPYDYQTVEKAIDGCDAVINTLNVSRETDSPWAKLRAPEDMISKSAANAVEAMKKKGIKRFVALSTIGAGSSWKSAPFILRAVVSMSNLKPAFMDHGRQEQLLEQSGLDYTICRAPMLTGEISDSAAAATPGGQKPAGMKLSRNAAAAFFLDIIEQGLHIKETVGLANGK